MARRSELVRLALRALIPLLLAGCGTFPRSTATQRVPIGESELQAIQQGLYDAGKLPPSGKTPRVRVLVVPHHLTAAVTMAAGLRSLSAQHPRSIVLLSPDHYHACPNLLCYASIAYESVLGTTRPDPDALGALGSTALADDRRDLFAREHGIYALAPLIAKLLPGTRVTPVVIAQKPDWKENADAMARLLRDALGPDGVLVASTDFSHYLPLASADEMDEKTMVALLAKDIRGLAALQNPSQSDCPACLWLAATIADADDAFNPSILLHTNSARLLGEPSADSTTSHFAVAFYANDALSPADVAVGGDLTVTRSGTGDRLALPPDIASFWAGDGPRLVNLEGPLRDECVPDGNPYVFCNRVAVWSRLRGLATHWGIENNHMLDQGPEGPSRTVAALVSAGETPVDASGADIGPFRVYALTDLMNPVFAPKDLLADRRRVLAALRQGDPGVPRMVFVHAGTEYHALPSDAEAAYARGFIDAGADAVFLAHAHVPGDMEYYRGKPIFRGLGNFLFDQFDKKETRTPKVVRIRPTASGTLIETLTAR